jgi:hypothetical protein
VPEHFLLLPVGENERTIKDAIGGVDVNMETVVVVEPSKIYEYDADQHLIYEAQSIIRGTTAEAVWMIFKYTYDANWNITLKGRASNGYESVWDNRLTYTYL